MQKNVKQVLGEKFILIQHSLSQPLEIPRILTSKEYRGSFWTLKTRDALRIDACAAKAFCAPWIREMNSIIFNLITYLYLSCCQFF